MHRSAVGLLLAPLCWLLVGDWVRAEGPYRMEGTVIAADTQQPIAGAEVQVLIQSEFDLDRRVLKAETDEQGRYSIELPIGHAWAWTIIPPAGYCMPDSVAETFATTDKEPIYRKDYQLQKGLPVEIETVLPRDAAAPGRMSAILSQQREEKFVSGFCELNEQGRGVITLADLTGKFTLVCGDESRGLQGPQEATIEFDRGFDPRDVLSEVHQSGEMATVRDAAGRTARLRGCEAKVQAKQLALVVPLKTAASAKDSATVLGQVVNAKGEGLAGATIEFVLHSGNGSTMSGLKTVSEEQGRFSLDVPRISTAEQISLAVTRAGSASLDTRPIQINKPADRRIEAGTVTLPAGSSIRIRVVDPDGAPLHGAIVEPLNGYAARKRIARTGADGECLLTDLAPGRMAISGQFGTLSGRAKIPLDRGENELAVIKLAPLPTVDASEPPPQLPPLAVGAPAPEWTIAEWTDGKTRTLADYRGKVVVLDFWGTWCEPCVKAIPLMKSLQERYRDRNVVFLGIHTAGTDMSLVKRLMKHEDWNLMVGLDAGESIASGSTIRSYAIHGFPNVVIVDPAGNVAFNNDVPEDARADQMREIAKLAKANGLPWPIDATAREEEILASVLKLHELLLTQAIDKALQVPGK